MTRAVSAVLGVLLTLLALAVSALALPAAATAQAPACPNPVPVVDENACRGAGTRDYILNEESDNLAGFTTKTSFAKGENVPLKIARNQPTFPATTIDIQVYRIGYYGGMGSRRISTASVSNVPVNNTMGCNPEDSVTGKMSCANWNVTHTIPGNQLPQSGVYIAKIRATDTGEDNWILWVVRDDDRAPGARVLFVLPTASYQAYNMWGVNGAGGKSLYRDSNGGQDTVAGTDRAVKVSFDRPINNMDGSRDKFNGPDIELVYWLEQQGYDVAYTDDVAVHQNPAELLEHKIVVIGAHSEYWSGEMMDAMKAARDAGVHIVNFGANTGYWKVRYEEGGRTLVCYKTVQGAGTGSSGAVSANDWGPDGLQGTADDALGLDQLARTADDRPQNSTTTFRDDGAPPGDPNAPPGGRVGPNDPENSLFGSMYVGDNDAVMFPLVIPPANANGEFAGDRLWRNSGIAENSTTSIGSDVVGWEWDQIPTQPQYLAHQPADVKRVAESPVTGSAVGWLQDEGRQRAGTPPPGQPATVSPVKYRVGNTWVFSAGTNHWGVGMTEEPVVSQMTYNLFSDMGVQPNTPVGVTLDPGGSNQPPAGAFTLAPNPARPGEPVTFNASASVDPDGTIARYQWDLDGDGTLETDSGTNPVATRTYQAEGTLSIRLRVTDNGGATELTARSLEVIGNRPPTAALTANPNPAVATQTVQFGAGGSSDPDGTIVRHEWDLDGNGSFERDTGATATTSTSYGAAGTVNAAVRVTDNGGKTATATVPVTVNSGGISNYGDAVLDTAGLMHYWRMGETTGDTFADSVGSRPATATGGVAFNQPGAVPADPNSAARFDGTDDAARATVDLAAKPTVTIEFWLNWQAWADNDQLAMELTANYNNNDGGILIDPNAAGTGSRFAVGIGAGATRNTAFFDRPTASQWHHYAFVLDTAAAAAQQITPYVDGRQVPYTKSASGTGGRFANAVLNFMSRNGTSLFGAGAMDEVAIYGRALDAATIDEHFRSYGTNRRPVARVTATPNPARTGQTVTFDGSSSSDPDGSITSYRWDLDGDGTFETNTGASPTATRSFASEGTHKVGLRVMDNQFGADNGSVDVDIGNKAPVIAVTATPNPAIDGQTVHFDASGSRDVDGTIARFEWDLDGNGSYETDTGTTATTSRAYTNLGTVTVGIRATDAEGKASTSTLPVTVNGGGTSNYGDTVLETAGLVSFWRMGEAGGTALADSSGGNTATLAGAPTLGVPGAVTGDPSTAVRFDGVDDTARAPVNLSGTQKLTVSFWLNWNSYANDDRLAMEFTDNFNNAAGGFLVDPNAPQQGGKFGVALGSGGGRNNVFFTRPSAGQWHHYAFVMDTTAPAAGQITPYVDGVPVAYAKNNSGTSAGAFANAALNLMSRGGTALFGAGALDEVALFSRTLTPNEISEQFASRGTNRRPRAAFTATPNPAKVGQQVTFNASGSSDPDGSIVDYHWDLDGNGSYERTSSSAQITHAYTSETQPTVKLRVVDNGGGSDTETRLVSIGSEAPTAAFDVTPNPAIVGQVTTFDGSASTDADGTIARYEWDLDGDGSYETDTGTTATTTRTYTSTGSVTAGLRVTDNDGKSATTTRTVQIRTSSYRDLVLANPALLNYWRMGETSGAAFGDSKGTSPATNSGATLGVAGALAGDGNGAARFNGLNNFAKAGVNLAGRSTITVEFWLKWAAFANDDDLAMEFTANYNGNQGGFLIDPNAAGTASRFAVGIGMSGATRNTAFFPRPTAGQWHHYAFVLDSTAPAAQQVTPYVDGQPVAFTKGASGTGAGSFANSTLTFMSRNGANLFGSGDLDELAIYSGALSAATIAEHRAAGLP